MERTSHQVVRLDAADGPDEVVRYDVSQMGRVERLDNGWIRCDATLTRAGIFVYKNPDGTERRELVRPETLRQAASVASIEGIPVTDHHPYSESPPLLNASNSAKYSKGSTSKARLDGETIAASILITDEALIADVHAGKRGGVSMGYTARMDYAGGTWRGQRFDCEQVRRDYNHTAIIPPGTGRAGPGAQLHLDANGCPDGAAVMVGEVRTDSNDRPGRGDGRTGMIIRIDGIDYDTEKNPEALAQAIQKQEAKADSAAKALAAAEKARDEEKARADALEKERDEHKAKLDAAEKEKADQARADLAEKVKGFVGDDVKIDGLSERELMETAIRSDDKDFDAKDESDDYVRARFDMLKKPAGDKPRTDAQRQQVDQAKGGGAGATETKTDAHAKVRKERADAWKQDL